MKRMFCISFLAVLLAPAVLAQPVVVDGVGPDDGSSPFATLQAAVNYCIAGSATDIEIQTNGPIAGCGVITPTTIPNPLTIRAASGYIPEITSNLSLIPANPTQQVTLEGLKVQLPNGFDCAAWIGCNVTATDCTFKNIPGGGGYAAALTCCTGGPGTTETLTLNNCYISGHNGLQAGRSIQDYILNDCYIEGVVSDLGAMFTIAIVNNMNWARDFSVRLDGGVGLSIITTPRTLTMNRCRINAGWGVQMGWPAGTLSGGYVNSETDTLGPIVATNCVFQMGDGPRLGNPDLAVQNQVSGTFRHCTWVADTAHWGIAYLQGPNVGHEFTNCLFDLPNNFYGIGCINPGETTITGDANIYNVQNPAPDLGTFETNYVYLGGGGPRITVDATGHLGPASTIAFATAVPLIPAVADDFDGDSRPLPVTALANDIGADEFDDNLDVDSWMQY